MRYLKLIYYIILFNTFIKVNIYIYILRVIVSTSSYASTITQVLVPKSDNNNNIIQI